MNIVLANFLVELIKIKPILECFLVIMHQECKFIVQKTALV